MEAKFVPAQIIEKAGIENMDATSIRRLIEVAVNWLKEHESILATVPEEFKDDFKEFDNDVKEMEGVRDNGLAELTKRGLTL